ncbi:hypothetical protein OEZ86_010924 [Tetradesmus obliquus]|nr:hypothetical protein OEZ86_010924 [Tetradesmus obliquus]
MATAAPVATTPAPAATPAGMIACYNGPVAPSNTAYSMLFPALQDGAPSVCASYQYKCSKGDTSCTAAEAAQGTSKYAYIWTLASTCSTMETMEDVYSDVLCCSGDLCNAPDATLDPTTKIVKTSQAVSVATAAPTQPAAAVEKAAAVAAGTDQPAATAPTDSSQPAEAVQMDPNAGGLPTDGVTPGQASTPGSSTVSLDGLSIAPVYSYRKDGAGGATLERAKSVNAADTESVSMLMFVFIGLLALAL